jgi:hypothetical protein
MDDSNSEPIELGNLYEAKHAAALERADRENPIPGGEPTCPVCGAKTNRLVEDHPSPQAGDSPFRVRLVCRGEDCLRWTVYNW